MNEDGFIFDFVVILIHGAGWWAVEYLPLDPKLGVVTRTEISLLIIVPFDTTTQVGANVGEDFQITL
jgi:hypothetical protein